MNCDAARLLIGADPAASTPELEAHLETCPACRAFREESRALEVRLQRALEQPPQLARRRAAHRAPAWQQWAMAASAVLAVIGVLAVWLVRPSETLAREVVAHVQHEPDSWFAAQHVSAAGISHALSGAGVALDVTSERIMYAQSCWFRGHYVPHLVVQTSSGPATVMILRHEHVRTRHAFHEDGMSGVIVPAGSGAIAVLSRGSADLMPLAGEMQHDVHWLSQPDSPHK